MATTLSFLSGLLVLLYLSTFVVFALLRIVTGISIQRLGWYGLRRISYTPKDGIRLDVRGLRISLHRPTFAQPTYVSVVLEELKVSVDLNKLGATPPKSPAPKPQANGSLAHTKEGHKGSDGAKGGFKKGHKRSRTWQKLTETKEKIKRLHRKLDWIRLFDVVATSTSLVIQDVGSVQVAQFTAAVDTRKKMVDRSRLFQHRRSKTEHQSPAEWIFTVRNILFSPEGQESTEILDHLTLNVHGLLYKDLDGLRDASIALKLGRLNVPFDDIHTCLERVKEKKKTDVSNDTLGGNSGYSFNDVMEELERPGSREEEIVQTVSDSKEFVSSILRGIQEIQFAVSFFGLTKRIRDGSTKESPVFLNMSMKEFGFDLLRLDPRSPAHLMYFSPHDIAHQALIAAIAISVGIDHGQDHPERLLYIPMATMTLKTTLPSKTIQVDRERDVAERNTNMLFANFVVTSPHVASRLLPKANVKFSVHEPVIRVTLPPMEPEKKDSDQFDLLISNMSSLSLDVESSHSAGGELHYSLASFFRMASHELYYQTASGEKHNLLVTEATEFKVQLDASPEVSVVVGLNFETFNIFMVRPEISEGVRQIVAQLRTYEASKETRSSSKNKPNFVRKLPKWLTHLQVQGSDFNVEVAGVDPGVSEHSRGCALHLDSWTAEYKADKTEDAGSRISRHTVHTVPTTPSKPEIITVDFRVAFIQAKATMPEDPPLMLQVQGFDAGRHRWASPFARAKLLRLYTEAPGLKKIWARMVSIKGLRVDLRSARRKYGTTVTEEKSIDVATEAVRIGVPHQLVVHHVFDNITNTIKTVEQLHHRFRTQSNEYVLDKPPEGPKKVPRISIRSQALLFEIEEGGFEWKLGTIFRLGLLEQRQRLAREEAFEIKARKLTESDRRRGNTEERRSRSADRDPRLTSPKTERGRQMRYDVDGTAELDDNARIHIEQAREKLNRLHSQSWKRRIDQGMNFQHTAIRDIRSMFWGIDDMPEEIEQTETILAIPQRPALMAFLVSDLNFIVDKPSFPISEYPAYVNRIGKGMPVDMQYSLLIPMSVQINVGEARLTLRDYPLPFIHVPAIRAGQSARLPSLALKTDFVIAEEYRDKESSRLVDVEVVPPEILESGEKSGGFTVSVRRTIAPVKTYSDMKVEVNTSYPTRITWGTSYQPAIQDMMQVIEGFTKAAMDPSEKVGFWDKIRLSFHSKINIAWKGDGDVHLILKGSRDPYKVTGDGAGFTMCWRNDVRLNLAQEDDPKKFITVDSGVCILAVPDLSHYARMVDQEESDTESIMSGSSFKQGASFRKTAMKLSGNVRWLVGLVFEREDEGKRSFDFEPHYNVILKHPDFAQPSGGKPYDAFKGFRSHHIHMSVAIAAPHDRDWSVANTKASANYNSVHLTPRFFSHFYSWWSLFSGAMALPVRQGALWPGVDKSGKKFGRHLATIKFSILLSPLYMSHIYKHKDPDDYGKSVVSATGLKVRLDSFMLDIHMRREEFRSSAKNADKPATTTGMRINQVQLDFISADIRAVSATISGTEQSDIEDATEDTLASYQNQDDPRVDLSKFTIPDNDLSWVDMDDFVELDWILPAESNPDTKILPLAFAPRFTYFRQTDHHDNISGDPHRSSPFGNEPTHYCVMSKQNDPRRVQCNLISERLKKVLEQIEQSQRDIGEQQLRILRSTTEDDWELEEKLSVYQHHHENLKKKRDILQSMHHSLISRLERDDPSAVAHTDAEDEYLEAPEIYDATDKDTRGLDATPLADYISDFNNRFVIHNAQVKWNNALRNIILRYIHQVSQRRGFVYYMSRRAVKFILDIVDEQNKAKEPPPSPGARPRTMSTPLSPQADDDIDVKDRIQQLLDDGKKFVNANDPDMVGEEAPKPNADNANEDIAQEFMAQNAYHVRLIAPQIQLQSEKNPKSAVLVTAKGMQLKVIEVMDKDRVEDDVSGLVQRRFSAAMDSLQIFVTSTKTFSTEYLHMYSGNRYGAAAGTSWPPWVPFEVMFEFDTNPYGFSRVVQRTSASLRYDKFNTLRLKYNDDISGEDNAHANCPDSAESRVDHLWVEFPHVRAVCDSMQYYAMYIIVLDLLLYSEPLERQRSEKLEKIMLASDFSDLNGAPELVVSLQERIHQLEEIKNRFQIHEQYLDREGWKNRIELERTLSENEEELFFMMKAITTSQRKSDDRAAEAAQPTGLLRYLITASEIVWHLVREGNESLAEFQLGNASFDRTDNSDGSNLNSMEIERIHGLNLLPDAMYPEMIAPYLDEKGAFVEGRDTKMLRVHWYMLEAIAGIPVMDHFEVNLFPLKVQLEREIGKKLFEYIFPGVGSNAFENGGFSPFMVKQMLPAQDEEGEVEGGEGESPVGQASPEVTSIHSHRASIDGSGPGALELRLQPTLTLPDQNRPKSSSGLSSRKGNASGHLDLGSFKMFDASSRTGTKADDINQMMNRASNYMTFAYIKIPSMVLCLSYKGKGNRNVEDLHDLVFRMPTIEYRNKTWSNLDLALALKKDVIRALISHTGAILNNKFHRPKDKGRFKQITNPSILLNTSGDASTTTSDKDSSRDRSPADTSTPDEPRRSFTSGRESQFSHADSFSSSARSVTGTTWTAGSGNGTGGSAILAEPVTFADEISQVDDRDTASIRQGPNTLHRAITAMSYRSRDKEPAAEDPEESNRMKSRLLLGKKFMKSLGQQSPSSK
ncbi:putative upf0648 protein [Neofusicoccum parvum UCRNP2]|uniref:Putative upf0648 protein n=1 Tax=Botryosphaeria parva (strain UCR-NP2) TaxID=1287680 RepID=R1EPG4_BOTPV|nr:putative upf0648 protein [Neofusicoccum parvum UCRNP2]